MAKKANKGKAKKKLERLERPTAKPRITRRTVDSPTVPGAQEHLSSVVDTVEAMRMRRQLDEFQYKAALAYRSAWDVLSQSLGGAMDFDKVRGGGGHGVGLSLAAADAGLKMRQVDACLDPLDRRLMAMIVGAGTSIGAAAADVYPTVDGRATHANATYIGRRFQDALRRLAEVWFANGLAAASSQNTYEEIRAWRDGKATAQLEHGAVIEPGGVVHATATKIFRGGGISRDRSGRNQPQPGRNQS